MSSKHILKYLQKYYLFFSSATALIVLIACSSVKKVPDGSYLLTKNTLEYQGEKIYPDEAKTYIAQKPNKKQFFFLPIGLWLYNGANPQYDSILNEYANFPNEMRNQKLRDSISIQLGHPEYVGRSMFFSRFRHNFGQAPVILDQAKSESSAEAIRKYLVYRGYWDTETAFEQKLDSAAKKASVNYLINAKDATFIDGYYYDIPDPNIKTIYEQQLNKSLILNKRILDQTVLEKEVKRINELMRDHGYYKFNAENQDIFFTADTLQSRKKVPLTLEIHKDSADSPYQITHIGNIKVIVGKDSLNKIPEDSLGIKFYKEDKAYKTMALWRQVISRRNDIYKQRDLDVTKRNFATMNNFNVTSEEIPQKDNPNILDLNYYLLPLPKYELKVATDVNYSQILNFGISPSVDLTSRNVFGGAENITTTLGGILGSVQNPKNPDKRILAYEISAQAALNIPKLLVPFTYYKLIPKKYSPTSSIVLGASIQDNIGMGRIGFNAGLNYFANVNDIVTHQLSILNTQFSLTRNKEKYYDYFTGEQAVVSQMHQEYFKVYPDIQDQQNQGLINFDQVSEMIASNTDFINNFFAQSSENQNLYYNFLQSLINKDRQTQDVLISSLMYNFRYNEIGKKNYTNPFYFDAKIEVAGNLLGLFAKKETSTLASGNTKTIFGIPYSQFLKLDFDIRKHFSVFDNNVVVLRQFIGLGIPYGNSKTMPFVRSYFTGGSNDIRAWRVFGGLGPADLQTDERVRTFLMDNVKLTSNFEYRMPFNNMFEGAFFVDAGNIWSLKDNGLGDQFKFSKFISQMGVGTGIGLRINVAYITIRVDAAYKVYDPNAFGNRWVIGKWQPLKPVLNFAFGYPF